LSTRKPRVGQTLVAIDHFLGIEVPRVGEQDQLAVEGFLALQGLLVEVPTEAIRLQDPRQASFLHRFGEAQVGATIRGLATA
jgi:hypothetical protein